MAKKRKWTNRKIAFISILVATSVAFVLIFTSIIPIAAIPSFKLAAGGLPVKLTGYIFGPIIGMITGILSDTISFIFRPVVWHYGYLLSWTVAGLVPGVIGYIMNRRWKKYDDVKSKDDKKYNNLNMFFTLLILTLIFIGLTLLIVNENDTMFAKQQFIKNKWIFLGLTISGMVSMFIGVILFRFILKPKTFNDLMPIIAFSAILEITTIPLLTLGDQSSFFPNTNSFLDNMTAHLLLSPIKIWINLLIIFFAFRIVSPLIYTKTSNGWEGKS